MAWAYRFGMWRRLVNRMICFFAAGRFESSAHLSSDLAGQKEPLSILNICDTGGESRKTLAG